jgi:cytochrome c556
MDMRSFVIGAALAAALGVGLAVAQSNPIKERQTIMKSNGDAVKLVSDMLKGEKPYDAKAAGDGMKSIHDNIGKFVTLFPVGTESGEKTRALPAIWKNKKDFEDWGKQLREDTEKAQAAAAGGADSMKTALAEVGKTCKGCHDDYRAAEK